MERLDASEFETEFEDVGDINTNESDASEIQELCVHII